MTAAGDSGPPNASRITSNALRAALALLDTTKRRRKRNWGKGLLPHDLLSPTIQWYLCIFWAAVTAVFLWFRNAVSHDQLHGTTTRHTARVCVLEKKASLPVTSQPVTWQAAVPSLVIYTRQRVVGADPHGGIQRDVYHFYASTLVVGVALDGALFWFRLYGN